MPAQAGRSLGSPDVGGASDEYPSGDPDFLRGAGEGWERPGEELAHAWIPPEDRLWRHPSEASASAPPAGYPPRRRSQSHGRLARGIQSTWAVAVVAGLVGALAATGVGVASGLWPKDTTVLRPSVQPSTAVSLAEAGAAPVDWTAVADAADPSVVSLTVQGAEGTIQGSGVVVLDSGGRAFVVTDRNLFSSDQAAGYLGPIEVTSYSGQTSRAKLVGQDPLSGLAVLVTAVSPGIPAAQIGSIAGLQQAAPVLAVGSHMAPSVSIGYVSGEDFTVGLDGGGDLDDLLAVTMPTPAPTSDGGPLLDQNARVVGVTVSLQPADASDTGFTFAVPGDEVARVATEIIDRTPVTHPWLGLTDATDVPSTMARNLGLSGGVQAGEVDPSGPAARAGMRTDDIVVSLDGRNVTSTGELVATLNQCVSGDTVPLTYVHDGRIFHTEVQVANEPPGG
jgi:S1-C subfamily serine protease